MANFPAIHFRYVYTMRILSTHRICVPLFKVRIRDAYLNYRALFSGYTLKVRI